MSDQIDMFPGKRGRGRPKGDRPALTGAQRMQRLREKAATVLYGGEVETGQTLADLSDTALIELVRTPIRDGYPVTVTEIMVELVKRADSRRSPHVDSVRLARWVNGGWYELTGQDKSCHVTENPEIPTDYVDMDNGHVTENESTVDQGEAFPLAPIPLELAMPVESKPSRSSAKSVEPIKSKSSASKGSQWADLVETIAPSASTQTKAKAVAILMKRDKATHADIIDVLKAGGVHCPASISSNLGRDYLPKYATESDVAEILATLETEHCKNQ